MSSPAAIAGVTAILRDLLSVGIPDADPNSTLGSVQVTVQSPDRITTGQTEANHLNLFLYQVTPNQGWRNSDLPNFDGRGGRVGNNPLALDLHLLLTAYGAAELNAEVLLGCGMQVLHETPILTRDRIRLVLDAANAGLPFQTLPNVALADQVELVKITPEFLSTEEMSKIWTATLAHYRPSMGYKASVVLIQNQAALRVAPPVLRQGPEDRGPVAVGAAFPTLTGVANATSGQLPALRLGEDVLLSGANLTGHGLAEAVLQHSRFGPRQTLGTTPAPGTQGQLIANLPSPPADPQATNQWAVGVYLVQVRVTRPDIPAWTTSVLPMALSPSITINPLAASAGTLALTVTCTPRLHPEQEAGTILIFGSTTVFPDSVLTPALDTDPTTLTFTIPEVPAGSYQVRLRVDGVDSLPVMVSGSPPILSLDPQQVVAVTP